MADEHAPVPSPHSSAQFTDAPGATSPSENNNGAITKHSNSPPHSDTNKPSSSSGMALFGRWLLGCLIVAVCGWGFVILSLYLMYWNKKDMQIGGVLTVLLDLGLFMFLERNFWLSRFMGLRIEPGERPWQSAFWLCLLGVPGVLFRSVSFHPEGEARAEARKRPQQTQQGDSVREVVETIVFVVVLVLLLKSFAAEAFVIPTGSMAETLLGYQKEVECPDCKTKFPINCSQEVDPSEGVKPTKVYACVCPNCRQRIHFPNPPRDFLGDNEKSIEIPDPGWNSGDRVLVAKFVYDLFSKDPDRLDVVVFKYPGGNDFPQTGPHRNHVPMNYIKRLIGLPGETIAISGGKLYYLSADKGPRYDDYEQARLDPDLMATLWKKEHMHIDEATDLFRDRKFQIIRKNPENILAMMRLVFDNDHPSSSDPASTDRWISIAGGWSALAARGFRHDGNDAGHTDWLRYHHILREFPGRRSLITDMMGYNTYQSGVGGGGFGHSPLLGDNWVGDLILECEATIDNPQGELTLELSRGLDRFRARWDLGTGTCTLLRVTKDGEQKLESKATAMKKKGTYRLRFANVDQRLVVWVDGELPFDNGVSYPPAKDLGPRPENDFEPASLGISGATVAIHKLKLFRDTYYTIGGARQGMPHEADVHGFDPLDPEGGRWKELRDPPFVTLYVQPDHFLCLGDNSPESSDGRSWGAVPRRLLLGRALLVYYPFGRAGRIR
jgi:signal peptidase I